MIESAGAKGVGGMAGLTARGRRAAADVTTSVALAKDALTLDVTDPMSWCVLPPPPPSALRAPASAAACELHIGPVCVHTFCLFSAHYGSCY